MRCLRFPSCLPIHRGQIVIERKRGFQNSPGVLRPRKKYTVFDLQKLKGKRCLTHIHVKSPEEAAAAEEASVDLISCSFDSPEAQARLPALVAAAPNSFLSCATPHGLASQEEAIRVAFRALEIGASSVYCSASPFIVEAMAREGIPVVGHLGLVPRHVTWTGWRAIGRTVEEAKELHRRMKELESAGAYAAELEVVPHNLARFLSSQTKMILMSLGSGPGCDTQFLFSDDILGDYDERPPRHAKAYRNFAAEHRRLQAERIAAFREYAADVQGGRFPERSHMVEMEAPLLDELERAIGGVPPNNQGGTLFRRSRIIRTEGNTIAAPEGNPAMNNFRRNGRPENARIVWKITSRRCGGASQNIDLPHAPPPSPRRPRRHRFFSHTVCIHRRAAAPGHRPRDAGDGGEK